MAKTKAHTANNLTAEVRDKTGKGASRQARRDGKVPAVLYGHGADPKHLLLSSRDFAAVLRPAPRTTSGMYSGTRCGFGRRATRRYSSVSKRRRSISRTESR